MAIRHLGDFFMPVSCLLFRSLPDFAYTYHKISNLQNAVSILVKVGIKKSWSESHSKHTSPAHKERTRRSINGLLKRSDFLKIRLLKGLKTMSEEKGNLKGLAISFILISLIMGAGVGIVYFVGQSIY